MPFGFSNPFRQSNVKSMPAQEAVERAAKGEIIVIDVRDQRELARTGKAQGALHIPLFLLNQKADPRHPECHPALKSDKPVAIYCASGSRSHMAAQTMSSFGFVEVYNIGGLLHWQSAGGVCEAA